MPAISRVWLRSLSEYSTWPYQNGFAFSRGGADAVGYIPIRRRQRRMKANPSGPSGLALQGASAALRALGVESTTPGAARLASAPLQSQRGSRGILRQAPQNALLIVPPSTRSAAPLVADDNGLATYVTMAATSSVVENLCSSDVGRAVLKNSFSTIAAL